MAMARDWVEEELEKELIEENEQKEERDKELVTVSIPNYSYGSNFSYTGSLFKK